MLSIYDTFNLQWIYQDITPSSVKERLYLVNDPKKEGREESRREGGRRVGGREEGMIYKALCNCGRLGMCDVVFE